MDEFTEGSHSLQPQSRGLRRTSFMSQNSAHIAPVTWPRRATTPDLRHRLSATSMQSDAYVRLAALCTYKMSAIVDASFSSDTDQSEIVAPIPRRHHILQTSESRHWLSTPPLSPFSPPTSPLSATTTSSARKKRISQTLSLNAIPGHDPRRVTSVSYPPKLHPYKEHQSDVDGSMGRRWLRWMHHENMKVWIIPSLILASIWVKWAVGIGSYSGEFMCLRQCYRCSQNAQGRVHLRCMVTMKPNDTGWS